MYWIASIAHTVHIHMEICAQHLNGRKYLAWDYIPRIKTSAHALPVIVPVQIILI
jgi:hypothetical protein